MHPSLVHKHEPGNVIFLPLHSQHTDGDYMRKVSWDIILDSLVHTALRCPALCLLISWDNVSSELAPELVLVNSRDRLWGFLANRSSRQDREAEAGQSSKCVHGSQPRPQLLISIHHQTDAIDTRLNHSCPFRDVFRKPWRMQRNIFVLTMWKCQHLCWQTKSFKSNTNYDTNKLTSVRKDTIYLSSSILTQTNTADPIKICFPKHL